MRRITLVALLLSLSPLGACVLAEPLPADEFCRNVGFQISSRTLACVGDQAQANERFESFQGRYDCIAADQDDTGFQCAVELGELSCEDVAALGDDLDAWLLRSEGCARILARKPGTEDFVPSDSAPNELNLP